jgi:hypothetical protein
MENFGILVNVFLGFYFILLPKKKKSILMWHNGENMFFVSKNVLCFEVFIY